MSMEGRETANKLWNYTSINILIIDFQNSFTRLVGKSEVKIIVKDLTTP